MNICEYAHLILFSEDLESKMLSPSLVNNFEFNERCKIDEVPDMPARAHRISFSDKRPKFPSVESFNQVENRAKALHFFANHELLAIEMMACAILLFQVEGDEGKKFRRGLLATIADEQKHFRLYQGRMMEWGVSFGDFYLNDFFWKQMKKVETPEQFYAVVALTFESANLDFALYYKNVFDSIGDERTSTIMQTVLDDEISHVKMGHKWINQAFSESDKNLWDIYRELLPEKLSPARAKGMIFNQDGRMRAGLDDSYISGLKNYEDPFAVVNRKSKESDESL